MTSENPKSQATDLFEVNSLVCNIQGSSDSQIPSQVNYNNYGSTSINTAWGIATSGMALFNSITSHGVDPFYPAVYGTVTDPD